MTPDTSQSDLILLENRQAALYAALAQYQHAATGEAAVHPGTFGLAIHWQREEPDSIRAILTHADGGSINSGAALIGDRSLTNTCQGLGNLLLGFPMASRPTSAQSDPAPAPEPVIAPAVEPEPEPEPKPEPAPAPAEPDPVDDTPPTEAELEVVLSAMDALHETNATASPLIIKAYKAQFDIGRTPFVKSITTRERLDAIQTLLSQIK